jgi:hypothetical protein
MTADQLSISGDIISLFPPEIAPTHIRLKRPRISITWPFFPTEENQVRKKAEAFPLNWHPGLKELSILDGIIDFRDQNVSLHRVNLKVLQEGQTPHQILRTILFGDIDYRGQASSFEILGTLESTLPRQSTSEWRMNLQLTCQRLPLKWFPDFSVIHDLQGQGTLHTMVKGVLGKRLESQGTLELKPVMFSMRRRERQKDYAVQELLVEFDLTGWGKTWMMHHLSLKAPGLIMDGSCSLTPVPSGAEHVNLKFHSDKMSIEILKLYFPSPLLPPWVKSRILDYVHQGRVTVGLLELNGTRDQLAHLDRPENASVFSCNVLCEQFTAPAPQLPLGVHNLSGTVHYADGNLDIEKVKMNFAQSQVKNLELRFENLPSKKPPITGAMDGIFMLEDVVRQAEFKLVPSYISAMFAGFESLTGKVAINLDLSHDRASSTLPRLKAVLEGEKIEVIHPRLTAPLSLTACKGRIDKNGVLTGEAAGSWNGNQFVLQGTSSTWQRPLDEFQVAGRGTLDTARLQSFFKTQNMSKVQVNGNLPFQGSVRRLGNRFTCAGKIRLKGLKLDAQSWNLAPAGEQDALDFMGSYDLNSGAQLDTCIIALSNSHLEAKGRWSRGDYSLNLMIRELSVDDLGVRHLERLHLQRGTFEGELHLKSLPDRLIPAADGFLRGSNLAFPKGITPSPIHAMNFLVRFNPQGCALEGCEVRVGESRLSLTGSLKNWPQPQGSFNLVSPSLNVTDIYSGTGFFRRFLRFLRDKIWVQGYTMDVQARVEQGKFKKFEFRGLTLSGNLNNQNIDVHEARFSTDFGVYRGTATIPLEDEHRPTLALKADINKQPLEQFNASLGKESKKITGLLTVKADVSSEGRTTPDLRSYLNGNVEILLEEGKIQQSKVLIKLFSLLNVQKLLKGKLPDIMQTGLSYETVSGTFAIKEGIASTENFKIGGSDVEFAAVGSLNFKQNTIDAKVGVLPLATVDSLLSKIPLIGYILTGKKKGLLVFCFDVKGSMTDPEVTMIPVTSVGDAVLGIIGRTLTTPVRLLQKIPGVSSTPE